MIVTKYDIIPDETATLVHGNVNFGPDTSARMVIDEGVILCAYGYPAIPKQKEILLKHGLIKNTKTPLLTLKGIKYFRVLIPISVMMAAAKAQETTF